MTRPLTLRPPKILSLPQPTDFTPPSIDFLGGTWHVTHSSLPMWKNNRNVTITYKPVPPPSSDPSSYKLEDIVSYQPLSSASNKTVLGIDTVAASTGEWNWRGKGWLKIASTHWEVLGYGGEGEEQWAVTYFAKTLFTPAGIDIYSRRREGSGEAFVEGVKEALLKIEGEAVKKLAGKLFEVVRN